MFFHPGFAAGNAVRAVLLAAAGAFGSPSALDGESGLLAAHGKRDAASSVRLFDGEPEILAVYHKPVPACNFAQTACQAAIALVRAGQCPPERIEEIAIRVPRAGAVYPGCDFLGPYQHVLQAKMSIQYNVAAALLTGEAAEANFSLLADPRLHRLLGTVRLEVDEEMTRAYPMKQGGAVQIRLIGGARHGVRLADVVNATAQQVRERFRIAAASRLGEAAPIRIEALIDGLEHAGDAGQLTAALGSEPV
jgi:2-methylcitrate dehydratase PrpD